MSSKRKTSSLSQSSASGSELSDAGRELELLASKKHKQSYAYSRWGFHLTLLFCLLWNNV